MIRLAFAAIMLFATLNVAHAQQKIVTLNLTVDEINQIGDALGTLPWKTVNPLIQKIVGQGQPQLAPPAPPAATGPVIVPEQTIVPVPNFTPVPPQSAPDAGK